MVSLGSSPLCEQSQNWARQASCSQSHNKGRTRPASLPGQSGKAQASGKGERPGAQDPQSWECPPRHHLPVRDGEAFPQVTKPLTMTFKPCQVSCAHLGEAAWDASFHRPFWKPAVGPAQAPRAFATLSDCALHSEGTIQSGDAITGL